MCKQEIKTISVAFVLFFVVVIFLNINCVNANNENKMRITVTNDNKQISDIHEIIFKTEKNPNVVTNKLAPGLKATAEIEVLAEKAENPVNLFFEIDDNGLAEEFSLTSMIDNKKYINNEPIRLVEFQKRKLVLELNYNVNGDYTKELGEMIEIPIIIRAELDNN